MNSLRRKMRMAAGVKAQNQKRTKVELALMVLVAISIVRQFFLGNYHNMFLGILTLLCSWYQN